MNVFMLMFRLLVAMFLLAVAAFCLFGFVATFEPPGWIALRIVYAVVGLAAVTGAVWLARGRRNSNPR